jgi:hypothetical protein
MNLKEPTPSVYEIKCLGLMMDSELARKAYFEKVTKRHRVHFEPAEALGEKHGDRNRRGYTGYDHIWWLRVK